MAAHNERDKSSGFVGVFDSGVGGISVLQHLVHELPREDFVYFGDSAHAPYGGKTAKEVHDLSRAIVGRMVDEGAKAVVIACNTATSAAAFALRQAFTNIPIVGVEPALKPAVLAGGNKKVLVMATEVTLSLDKYHRLSKRWASGTEVETVGCTGLAERIEKGDLDAPDLLELLHKLVGSYRGEIDRVVLGCTHYPFVRAQIAQVLGDDVRFFDGGVGTARQLHTLLAQNATLSKQDAGQVSFSSSIDTPEELALYRWFYDQPS